MTKKFGYIYKITNLINDKVYIGQTLNILVRWRRHKRDLNKGIHGNRHLQRAWNKYGRDNFSFKILGEYSQSKLNAKEIYFVRRYKSINFKYGYNLISVDPEQKIALTSKASRRNRSKAAKKSMTPKVRRKISRSLLGHTVSANTRRKMSEAHKGNTSPNKGKTFSAQWRKKLSAAQKKRFSSLAERKRISKLTKLGMKRAGFNVK